jgi:demethylmenaquinone methyltransferase / 2-methoxy-6-polyprenyl-1,4-benzoquinol methylase
MAIPPFQTPASLTMTPVSQAVRDLFDGIAPRYDLVNRVLSARSDVRWRRRALGLIEGSGHRTLDLACGTGDFALAALGSGVAGTVHGCDFSRRMLSVAQGKAAGHALTLCAGDALDLPFADRAFDLVTIAYGWRNLDDPLAGLREMRRVLRPGGQLLILEFFRPCRWWPRVFYATFGRCAFPVVGGVVTGDASAYRYLNDSVRGFLSHDEALGAVAGAGFAALRWRSCFGGISHAVAARAM